MLPPSAQTAIIDSTRAQSMTFTRELQPLIIAAVMTCLGGQVLAAPPGQDRSHRAPQQPSQLNGQWQRGARPPEARSLRPDSVRAPGLSAQQAGEIARSRYGGQVLDVRPVPGDGGRPAYRIKLLNQGEVRTVVISDGN